MTDPQPHPYNGSMDEALDQWLGRNNYEVWCISLKRAVRRRDTFRKWANEIGLTFRFWDATDYLEMPDTYFKTYCDVHLASGKRVTGASACRISITKCLESFVQMTNKGYVFVLEDDAGFVPDGKKSGSSGTDLSYKENLIEFVRQCCAFTNAREYGWQQVWFGYYDGDVEHHTMIDPVYPLVCRSLGTCSTHSMLFQRGTVENVLLPLLRDPRNRREPIDSITKWIMSHFSRTLIPPRTIICQTDDERYINY